MQPLRLVTLVLILALAACGDDDAGDGMTPTDAGPLTWDPPAHCTDGPLDAPIPGCAPTPEPSTGDPAQDCVNRINQLRAACQCLPPLARWVEGESCADQQAAYDAERDDPHAGFRDGICNGGFGQNECPGWSGGSEAIVSGCLQLMWDEGPGEDFQMHGHYLNMTNPSFSEVACGYADGPDGLWAVQNFR